jgi:hypothetical protein
MTTEEELTYCNCKHYFVLMEKLHSYLVNEYISPMIYLSASRIFLNCAINLRHKFPVTSIPYYSEKLQFNFHKDDKEVTITFLKSGNIELQYPFNGNMYKYHQEVDGVTLAKKIDEMVSE